MWVINSLTFTLTIISHTMHYTPTLLQFMGFLIKPKSNGLSKIPINSIIISHKPGENTPQDVVL